MTSSTQSHSPLQWFFAQVSHSSLGIGEGQHKEHCQSFPEKYFNLESSFTGTLKDLSNSTKTLQYILNNHLIQKPFIIWNTNSVGENILHTSNCFKLNAFNKHETILNSVANSSHNSILLNNKINSGHNSVSNRKFYIKPHLSESKQVKEQFSNSFDCLSPTNYITLSQASEGENSMVTSSSSPDLCDVNELHMKNGYSKSKYLSKASEKNTFDQNHKLLFGNPKIETNKSLETKTLNSNNYNKDDCENIQKKLYENNHRGPELEEVGKILENVLWQKPISTGSVNNAISVTSGGGGSDTGYSSRCSTPNQGTESPTTEPRLENADECRSKSPSEWSESSSQGSYQPPRSKRRLPHHSFHHYGPPPEVCLDPQRPIVNNRELYQGNNYNRNRQNNIGYNAGFRKTEKITSFGALHNRSNQYSRISSHFDTENRHEYGQNRGSGDGRTRHSNSQKHRHHPHQQPFAPVGFYNDAFFQMNPHRDVRKVVGNVFRKLSDSAGTFSSDVRWRVDLRSEATVAPPELITGSTWDTLSRQVWNMFTDYQQLDNTFRAKMELKDRISAVIWNVLPICRLFVVGSSLSGFGANRSDVDMCLMVTPRDLDQRNDAQAVLRLLQRELNNCGFVEKMELITAKVPILKFRDSITGIDVDLNCNNSVGIRNTHLLNAYSQLDWRVRPLVLVVKLWAQHHCINNAKDMTVSSYSLVLMVIHYLQYGTEVPLLPCLHEAFPDKFNCSDHIFKIPVTERMPLFISNNKQSLGELFLGFLDYYTQKFKYSESAISVRTGSIIPIDNCRFVRTKKNDSRMWKYLCIEEPFDLTNTARSVYDEVVFEKVRNVFKESFWRLNRTRDLNRLFENDASVRFKRSN